MNLQNRMVWLLTLLLSIIYIFIGNRIATKDFHPFTTQADVSVKAKVISIDRELTENQLTSEGTEVEGVTRIFTCKVLSGEHKGEVLTAVQTQDIYFGMPDMPLHEGDHILLYNYPMEEYNVDWVFGDFERFGGIVKLGVLLLALMLLFGRKKGANTILSLVFTCLSIFGVFIPSILSGQNIYANTLLTCTFITIMTLLFTNGWSKKTLATILGCLFGVIVAALLSRYLDSALQLTGHVDEHSTYLTCLPTKHPVDLKAITFASVVVGALGAVMDVAMDIASSLGELKEKASNITRLDLVRSGINIGRDIMGTMSNTLVLAYIGSSLSTVLLLITYATNLNELLNRELIIVELMQALIGSSAILLTIPLTAIVCGLLYYGRQGYTPRHLPEKTRQTTGRKVQRKGQTRYVYGEEE